LAGAAGEDPDEALEEAPPDAGALAAGALDDELAEEAGAEEPPEEPPVDALSEEPPLLSP
jgi:hypothetical protein